MSFPGYPPSPSGPGDLTTSGDYDYDPPATNVITRAYRILGVINEIESPSSSMLNDGLDTLNAMAKELMATGIHIWTVEEAILFTQQFQALYYLYAGTAQAGYPQAMACDADQWGVSQLNASVSSGGMQITLDGQYGSFPPVLPAVGMNVGINLDTGATFWTTITAVAGLVISLAAPSGLPSQASAGEFAFWFAPAFAIQRPLRVPFARRINYGVGTPGSSLGPILTPLTNMLSRQEYFALPQLQAPGDITQAFYNPARDIGEMRVWNVPQNGDQGMRFTYYRPIQNFDTVDDLADLPKEWDMALKWGLAKELAPQYDIPEARWDRIVQTAAQKLDTVAGWDREPQSVYFGRSYDQVRR